MTPLVEYTSDPILRLIPWVVFSPLIGLLINLLIGKKIGEKASGWIGSLAVLASFGTGIIVFMQLLKHPEPAIVHLADWIRIGTLHLSWDFRVDTLSMVMVLVVSGVAALIHVYSIGYMHHDVRHQNDPTRFTRFFIYMNLFVAAMMILVTANNFLMLFVGWEGVGLCSFLLIGFWFEKGQDGWGNAKAGKKAFIVNRIGDFGLLVAMFLMFWHFGSLDFDVVFSQVPAMANAIPGVLLAITLLMLLGVTGKSAQIPLFVWLPDAMAGPTPVSALIHAATMVTAGVYLIARSSVLFNAVPAAQQTVAWVGAATALFSATIAVAQTDIKKVLAYSTISQLGFMVAAVGMGAYVAGIFHLATHAFFKALLFLAAGSVVLGVERGHEASSEYGEHDFDAQDMRNMGGLKKKMPATFWVYLIGSLALAGIPPLSGFFSKDEILAAASEQSMGILVVLILAAFLTAFYITRQLLMVFFGKARTKAAENAKESPPVMLIPLIILAILAFGGGVMQLPELHTLGHWLEHSLVEMLEVGFSIPLAATAFVVALIGLVVAWNFYGQRSLGSPDRPDPLARPLAGLYTLLADKWRVDELYQVLIVSPFKRLSGWLAEQFDQQGIDQSMVGLGHSTRLFSAFLARLQNGFIRTYAMVFFFGVVVLFAYLFLR
ncbi:MAG: NADH-quinone oxidoreductase subunit L [Anaerolineaceae bacterium]|nr:NADH-quinone oxidoreductase subunit L [Anaerolineaceae bacterium]